MRYHADPDQGILWSRDTAVVSVGATRRFAFREMVPPGGVAGDRGAPHVFTLMSGDVAEMFEDCQERYQHTVKTAEDKREKAARSSLVFKKSLGSVRS